MNIKDKYDSDVGVIATVFNTKGLLKELLQSIELQKKSFVRINTYIFDNGSKDDPESLVKEFFPWVKFHKNKINIGQVKALNYFARLVNTKYFLFCHSDVVLENNAIEELYNFMEYNLHVGVVSPKLYLPDKGEFEVRVKFPTIWSQMQIACSSFLHTFFGRKPNFLKYKRSTTNTGRVDFTWTPVVMIRSNIFKELNGFNNELFSWKHIEDFCWRAGEKGYESWYFDKVAAMHYDVQTPKKYNRGSTRYKSDFNFARKIHTKDLFTFYNKHYKRHEVIIFRFCLYGLYFSKKLRIFLRKSIDDIKFILKSVININRNKKSSK